jgi:thiol-disulfide isomerase/thioredoxin
MQEVKDLSPNIEVQEWFQGDPTNIDQELGKVIVIEFFQVNCPGCFVGAIPEAIQAYQKFKGEDILFFGVATAFEDYNFNTIENLKKLLETGEVVGETLNHLTLQGHLPDGRLEYRIPFPVAWDKLVPSDPANVEKNVDDFIQRDFPNWEELAESMRSQIRSQVTSYFQQKKFEARTFDKFRLRGTPTTLIIDKAGYIRYHYFGSGHDLKTSIQTLLDE